MRNFGYTEEFARSIWLPFSAESAMGRAIVRAASTFEDFTGDPAAWRSQDGTVYSEAQMRALWECVEVQKVRVMAFWLVAQGVFRAVNPALAALR